MIYPILVGYDTGGELILKWKCDCKTCLTTASSCQNVIDANEAEKSKPQDAAIYASLRR